LAKNIALLAKFAGALGPVSNAKRVKVMYERIITPSWQPEAQEQPQVSKVKRDLSKASGYDIVQMVSRGDLKVVPDPRKPDEISYDQFRAARDLLAYDKGKAPVDVRIGLSFADGLEQALARASARSNGTKVIEHQAAGSLVREASEAEQVSREHSARPILPRLTRRI